MPYKHNYRQVGKTVMVHPRTGERYSITLDIDPEGILDVLGAQAMQTKNGEARACNGDVRVRARVADKEAP